MVVAGRKEQTLLTEVQARLSSKQAGLKIFGEAAYPLVIDFKSECIREFLRDAVEGCWLARY